MDYTYALTGGKWQHQPVTWSFATSNLLTGLSGYKPIDQFISDPTIIAAVKNELSEWSSASGITFVEVADSVSANIRFGMNAPLDMPGGAIGYTWTWGSTSAGSITAAEEFFSTDLLPGGQYSAWLSNTVAHEIGRAIGLGTSSNPADVMAQGNNQSGQLSASDAAGAQVLYGPSSNVLLIARLYQAALGREPDTSGLNYYITNYANGQGQSLSTFATGFINSPEFTSLYGNINTMSNTAYITALYANVLHRIPVQSEINYYLNDIAGGDSEANILLHFSASPENVSLTGYLSSLHLSPTDGTWSL